MVTGFSAEPVSPALVPDPVPQAARAAADAVPTATVVRKFLLLIMRASLLDVCNPSRPTYNVSSELAYTASETIQYPHSRKWASVFQRSDFQASSIFPADKGVP